MSDVNLISDTIIEEDLSIVCAVLEEQKRKYNVFKLLLDTAYDCVITGNNLSPDLNNKAVQIILAAESGRCMRLDSNTLLGLTDLCNVEGLSFKEGSSLKDVVERGFEQKWQSIAKQFEDITSEDINSLQFWNATDEIVLEHKHKLNDQLDLHLQNLLTLAQIYKDVLHVRFQALPEAEVLKLSECTIKSQMYYLRAKMVETKSRVDTFKETSFSLAAYESLLREIVEEQKECQKEIDRLQDLKHRYEAVSCKEFNEILKEYLKYKSSIDGKRETLKKMGVE